MIKLIIILYNKFIELNVRFVLHYPSIKLHLIPHIVH
jgi:hypothetical protein